MDWLHLVSLAAAGCTLPQRCWKNPFGFSKESRVDLFRFSIERGTQTESELLSAYHENGRRAKLSESASGYVCMLWQFYRPGSFRQPLRHSGAFFSIYAQRRF